LNTQASNNNNDILSGSQNQTQRVVIVGIVTGGNMSQRAKIIDNVIQSQQQISYSCFTELSLQFNTKHTHTSTQNKNLIKSRSTVRRATRPPRPNETDRTRQSIASSQVEPCTISNCHLVSQRKTLLIHSNDNDNNNILASVPLNRNGTSVTASTGISPIPVHDGKANGPMASSAVSFGQNTLYARRDNYSTIQQKA
jgi:hypothetical protein